MNRRERFITSRREETQRERTATTPEAGSGAWATLSEAFRQELLERVYGRLGRRHCGAERRESDVLKAGRLIEKHAMARH